MALGVRNEELPSYENSRGQGGGKGNILCLFGVGKLFVVWVLCHCSLYELFEFGILLFLCCFWETKAFLERYTLSPCIQENAEKLRQIADKSYGEEQACPCERSLLISQVGSLFFLLAAQLKSLAHWKVVWSPSGHLSSCYPWQPCLRSSGLGFFVSFFFFFWWKAFFLGDLTSTKIEKPCKDQNSQ